MIRCEVVHCAVRHDVARKHRDAQHLHSHYLAVQRLALALMRFGMASIVGSRSYQ